MSTKPGRCEPVKSRYLQNPSSRTSRDVKGRNGVVKKTGSSSGAMNSSHTSSTNGDVKATKSTSTPTREKVPKAVWDISDITTISGVSSADSIIENKNNQDDECDLDLEMNKLRLAAILNHMVISSYQETNANIEDQLKSIRERIDFVKNSIDTTAETLNAIYLSKERHELESLMSNSIGEIMKNKEGLECIKNMELLDREMDEVRSTLELFDFHPESADSEKLGEVLEGSFATVKEVSDELGDLKNSIPQLSQLLSHIKSSKGQVIAAEARCNKLSSGLQSLALHEASLQASLRQSRELSLFEEGSKNVTNCGGID